MEELTTDLFEAEEKRTNLVVNKEYIRRILSETKTGLHIKDIAQYYVDRGYIESDVDMETLAIKIGNFLASTVKSKSSSFSRVKGAKSGSYKRGYYKLKAGVKLPELPEPPVFDSNDQTPNVKSVVADDIGKTMLGKAGECAVMSELLYNGYNANTMMVDDGVDIVASKNNLFYFIQVKTSILNNNRLQVHIKKDRFDAFIASQIRYVVVARFQHGNLFFIFSNSDIERFIFNNTVSVGSSINIKIRIDQNTKRPMLHNNSREEDISFFQNKWDL